MKYKEKEYAVYKDREGRSYISIDGDRTYLEGMKAKVSQANSFNKKKTT